MNLKKNLTGLTFSLIAASSFAQPNTVTISGELINSATSTNSQYNYIATRIFSTNPSSDNTLITINNGAIAPNQVFSVSPNKDIPYSIIWNALTSNVYIDMYDSNCFYECQWAYYPPSSNWQPYPHLMIGSSTYCITQNGSNFMMKKACSN